MPTTDLNNLIEEKLNHYARKITEAGAKTDEHAFGELSFYLSLRRVMTGKATMQDVGLMDAINDTLANLGRIEEGKVFYK